MVNDILAGRYRLEEPIATGGMGTVWRAHDEVLQRAVAVKLLNESLAGDDAASERFRREALTAASITHPHMANVYDYVEEDGRPGIVMELVEGETLATTLARERRLSVAEAVRIATDVLTALEAAHEAGIVHRDIKPGNILLMPNGRVKVGDFGIARSLGESSLTVTGTVMGTAHYSAPEQVRGQGASPCTDLYAVGVVLYEMLVGRRPFEGDSQIAVAMARLERDPEPPRASRPSIPAALDAAVMRALAREPENRFTTAAEMRAALDATTVTAAIDPRTAVLPVGGGGDTTVAMRAPSSPDTVEAPLVAEYIPPRWAGRRFAVLLLPLMLLGLVAFWVVAATRGGEAPASKPSVRPTPTKVSVIGRVPNLDGLTVEQANRLLAARALVLDDVSYVYSSSVPAGRIFKQSADASRVLKPGTNIDVVVSRGPAPAPHGKGRKHHDDFVRARHQG